MLKRAQVMAVRQTYQGHLLLILARSLRFREGISFAKSLVNLNREIDQYQPGNSKNN